MARYIKTTGLAALAQQAGVSETAMKSFIATQRADGNVAAVLAYVDANPGATEADVQNGAVEGSVLDAQTTARLLLLLVYVGLIVEF